MTVHFMAKTSDGLQRGVAEAFQFPGGEWHLRNILDDTSKSTVWIADVRGADLNDLAQAAALANVAHLRQAPFVLMLPYLPAARSDRSFEGGPIGAQFYSDMIAGMNPQQILGVDPHSPAISRYMRNKLYELDPFPLLERALNGVTKYDAVIAPDKGAFNRAHHAAGLLGIDCYQGEKHRDEGSGRIAGITIEGLPQSGRYLVVDDICDGGGTFMGLAEATGLHRDQLGLWVTHGIFSGHAIDLRQDYSWIGTTDSHPGHNRFGDRFSATKHDTETVHIADAIVPCESYMLDNMKDGFHMDTRLSGF